MQPPDRPAPIEGRCTAVSTRSGQPCRNRPVAGATVCRMHGGAAPQVKRKAAQRRAETEARRFLAQVDVVPLGNPIDEIFDLAAKVKAMMGFVESHVATVDIADWQSFTSEQSVQLSVYVGLLRDLQVQLERSLVNIVKLSQDERMVRLREKEVTIIIKVIEGALVAAGLSEEKRRELLSGEVPRLLELHADG